MSRRPQRSVVGPTVLAGLALAGAVCVPTTWALPELGQGTVGQARCAGCHEEQNKWWYDDPHSFATARLQPGSDRYARYALVADRYAGLAAKDMARPDSICLKCHGMPITAEAGKLESGVGCESCHGPAERWLETHREGDKSLGVDRPGYRKALQSGMRALKQFDVTAETCTDCHYITDRGLLMAGHPDGIGWDLAALIEKVDHWSTPLPSYEARNRAFDAAKDARGRPPRVARPVVFAATGPRKAVARTGFSFARRRPPRTPVAGSAGADARARSVRIDLPDFALSPDLPPGEKLRLLSERLSAIHRELRRAER